MSEMTYEPLMVEPAGVPRGRAMVERADWAARAYAKYDIATVNRIVDAAATYFEKCYCMDVDRGFLNADQALRNKMYELRREATKELAIYSGQG